MRWRQNVQQVKGYFFDTNSSSRLARLTVQAGHYFEFRRTLAIGSHKSREKAN
jgi:hypothetical protein